MSVENITHLTLDRVLVELTVGAQEGRFGIVIPAAAQSIEPYGIVLMVGPDCSMVHVGDRVLVDLHAGIEVQSTRTTRVVLFREKDIQAILDTEVSHETRSTATAGAPVDGAAHTCADPSDAGAGGLH